MSVTFRNAPKKAEKEEGRVRGERGTGAVPKWLAAQTARVT